MSRKKKYLTFLRIAQFCLTEQSPGQVLVENDSFLIIIERIGVAFSFEGYI